MSTTTTTRTIHTAAAELTAVGERLPIQQGTLREEQGWQDAIRGARRALGLSDPAAELKPVCDYCNGILWEPSVVVWGCTCGMSDAEYAENYRFWCD